MGERLLRRQLRQNGELLLRVLPPGDPGSLRAVETSTWSEGWTAFYAQHPDLEPRLQHSETFPRERLPQELAALFATDREHVLAASLHDHPEAVGRNVATVAGSGAAVAAYVLELVDAGHADLFVLDEPAGTAYYVDQDQQDAPGAVLLQQYRWPEVED